MHETPPLHSGATPRSTAFGAAPGASPSPARATALSVAGLHVHLGGRHVLQGVDFALPAGQFTGLIGPNGAGKTTLLRSILGLIPTTSGTINTSGVAEGPGAIGYVPQRHEFAWDFPISVEQAVINGRARKIGWFRRPKVEDYRAAADALKKVRLLDLKNRPIGELSGGQRQRVLVARALALEPQILLLDEPFTGMDVPSAELLVELFQSLAHDDNMAVLMSTHDLPQAMDACDRMLMLHRVIVADAPPAELHTPEPWMKTFSVSRESSLLKSVGAAVEMPSGRHAATPMFAMERSHDA